MQSAVLRNVDKLKKNIFLYLFFSCTLSKKGGMRISPKGGEVKACEAEVCVEKKLVGKFQNGCVVTLRKMSRERAGKK